jgi:hypothetical protein
MTATVSADDVLRRVAARLGAEPSIIRHGMNLVARCGECIVRVGAPPTDGQPEPTAMAHRLGELGLAVPRSLAPPELLDGWWVTMWELMDATDEHSDVGSIGRQIRSLHALPVDAFDGVAALSWCAA